MRRTSWASSKWSIKGQGWETDGGQAVLRVSGYLWPCTQESLTHEMWYTDSCATFKGLHWRSFRNFDEVFTRSVGRPTPTPLYVLRRVRLKDGNRVQCTLFHIRPSCLAPAGRLSSGAIIGWQRDPPYVRVVLLQVRQVLERETLVVFRATGRLSNGQPSISRTVRPAIPSCVQTLLHPESAHLFCPPPLQPAHLQPMSMESSEQWRDAPSPALVLCLFCASSARSAAS